jgi:translocation and assembly module TamB
LRNVVLVNAHQGKASMNAAVALRNWKYLPTNAFSAAGSIQDIALADLQRLANVHYPVSGDLSAEISLHGSQLNPVGNGSAKIIKAQAYGEPIQTLAATFNANSTSLTSTLKLKLAAGALTGAFTYTPKTKAYNVRLEAPAVILQKLQTVQAKNLGAAGTLTLSASGAGTLENPQLDAAIAIPQLQWRDKTISQMKAQLHVAEQKAAFTLEAQAAQANLRAHANVSLTGNYDAEAAIDISGIPLQPLLAMYSPNPPPGFSGETELHATLKGPLKYTSKLEAHLTIPTLTAKYQTLEIGAASPIQVDYVNSLITLQPAEIRGTGTSLQVQGTFPLNQSAASNLRAQGSVDVRIAKIFSPDLQSSGSISLDVHASGTAKNPSVQGQLRFQDVALSSAGAPLGVQKLNGNLQIANNTLQLTGLTGEVGGGTVSAGGSVSYRPNLQFNITLQSKSVRLRYPQGVRALLDGDFVLSGTKDSSIVTGRVLIDSLNFTPDFDLSKFSDQFGGASVPAAPGILDAIKLGVAVQSKNNLTANSSQISIEGDTNLQVIGTAANPVIVGRTDLTSGELFYRNVRYQLQRGIVTFDNPAQTEPTLNLSVTTTIEQYNLTITLRGTFDKLTTSYTSDPPLATADVINLIANGQTTSEASAAGTSTDSILASQAASQVTGGIQHLAGISSLQIDPLLGGNNQNPSARVAIQQRASRNFLFTFSEDLSQPGSEVVQGDYRLNNRWSVSVTRDELGGVSVGGKLHTKF